MTTPGRVGPQAPSGAVLPPSVTLPTPGGAVRGLGEKFATNPVTGSASLSLPLPATAGRSGFGPQPALSYDSAAGQSAFGYGWRLEVPAISRQTERGVPRYTDETDVFMLSGAEDLVPVSGPDEVRDGYRVRLFRPRKESGDARIERFSSVGDCRDVRWRVISGDNMISWYGISAADRVFDPSDPGRIFSWLLSHSHDDKGNVMVFEYKAEDSSNVDIGAVNERHRTDRGRTAARHLSRIRYGNMTPYYPADGGGLPAQWHFELALDYGDVEGVWPARDDPFSTYRGGFEIRTYRLCRRALMYHRFRELGDGPRLVASTEFAYETRSGHTFLTRVTRRGHDGDETAALPPLTLAYRPSEIDEVPRDIPLADAPSVPAGLDNAGAYRWIDLDGEGSCGVLAPHRQAWWYSRNMSALRLGPDGRRTPAFAAARLVTRQPNDALADPAGLLLADVEGLGAPGVLRLRGNDSTVAVRDDDGSWRASAPPPRMPSVRLSPEELRFADLTGDGLPDLVADNESGARWYECLGRDGYAAAMSLVDGATGAVLPRLTSRDRTELAQFADMSGDGLPDLVRIGNGRVCYRPNLGHGRFGPWVSMADAPWFDDPQLFDPRRVLLADVDGTGSVDLIYLSGDGARLYFNICGDRFGPGRLLAGVPAADNLGSAAVVDLLGTGTGCLVWSSPLPGHAAAPMRYLDLMGGVRPHLLTGYTNGMGSEVRVEYQPSTYFYLLDEQAGRPWPSRLPFPVQCAHRVTTLDHVRETVFVTRTSYHDGYYDAAEREFRGFGMVETVDTESYDFFAGAANVGDPSLHRPPVLSRNWFHTGAAAATGQRLLHARRERYFDNPLWTEHRLPEPELPPGLTDLEYREAAGALKGAPLRTEIYSLDGSPQQEYPYTASELTYRIELVQPRGTNRHAVFRVLPAETIGYAYDRVPDDPRITHSLVLETDGRGMVRRSASVVYPRQVTDAALPEPVRQGQARRHITYLEHDYTVDVSGPDTHRPRTCFESRSFELMGPVTAADPGGFLSREDLLDAVATAARVPYEQLDGAGVRLRLLEWSRATFLADDLSGPLPLGTHQSLGLLHRTHRLALTHGLAASVYGTNVSDVELAEAGYVAGDGGWWIRSGEAVLPPGAREHFYLPNGFRDPFGLVTTVERDHDLLTRRVVNPLGHAVEAVNDWRVMQPSRITDANGNHSSVRFDPLGAVVAAAVSGKDGEGDTLDDPTTTVEYDLVQTPARLVVRHRERHGEANPRWQDRHVHLDGGGEPVMAKTQAPPGLALVFNPDTGEAEQVDTGDQPRWIGNGRTVFDNRGAPVKQYEPYFSTTPGYESEAALVETGVTAVIRYDAIGRVSRVDLPDGTFTRHEYGAWVTRAFDANDTVRDSLWYAERGSPQPSDPEPADPQQRAAWLAAAHAGTASVSHLDSLGRVALSIADNGAAGTVSGRSEADLTGHVVTAFDSRDRAFATSTTDMLGNAIRTHSAERGTRWTLTDAAGVNLRVWDGSGREFRTRLDTFRRPESIVCSHAGRSNVVSRVVYGDDHPEALQRNLIGLAHALYDTAGVTTLERADFRGRPVELTHSLTADPLSLVDWSGDPEAALEAETYTATAVYDALGRVTSSTLPDGSVLTPTYDVANRPATLSAVVHGLTHTFLAGERYDAKGRRLSVELGNGAVTGYTYDPRSLRVTGIRTAKGGNVLQDLAYVYDPVGNLTEITDHAQQTLFFANSVVAPDTRYTYDALYRLVRATGREHASLAQADNGDLSLFPLPHANDAGAMRRYAQTYRYDDLGNITEMRHSVTGGGWTRRYRYAYDVDPADGTNRLVATSLPGDPEGTFNAAYTYDAGGNMLSLPHLPSLTWDVLDRLTEVDLGGGGTAHYAYGAGGRVRKIVRRQGGLRTERRYLGAVEVYREWMNDVLRLERWTLHISDGSGRVAQVDTLTVDTAGDGGPLHTPVIRYQYTNHLGSSTLETDVDGVPISYEEYHPFGTTAFRSARPQAGHSLKRYRYAGKERDDETGLHAMGARYYAAWLGRWTSADPAGFADGPNLYAYCRNNPVMLNDPTGTQGQMCRILPDSYPELDRAYAADRASFRDTFETARVFTGRSDLVWRIYQHERFGRVWEYWGSPGYPPDTFAWSFPPLMPEAHALVLLPHVRIENVAWMYRRGSGEANVPRGGARSQAPPSDDSGGDPGTTGGESVGSQEGPGDESGGRAAETGPGAPAGGDAGGDALPRIAGQSAVITWDSHHRGRYMRANRAASQDALRSIRRAAVEGNADDALRAAEAVAGARNLRRMRTQGRLSPGGRALSRALDAERSVPFVFETYAGRLPGVEGGARVPSPNTFETARRVAVAAGESRGSLRALTRVGRVAGPVGLAVGGGLSIHAVATAPEGQRGRVAARETGSFLGGALGASLGTSLGVSLAGGISTILVTIGVASGPIGWLAIGLGVLGALALGWAGAEFGGQLGDWVYGSFNQG